MEQENLNAAKLWTERKAQAKANALLQFDMGNKFKKRPPTLLDKLKEWEREWLMNIPVMSPWFEGFIIFVILVNIICVAIETDLSHSEDATTHGHLFYLLDLIFMSIYFCEFVLKVIAKPVSYWLDNYNLFDFTVLAVSMVGWISGMTSGIASAQEVVTALRAFRAFRALRAISFIKSLQVLLQALIITITKNSVDILLIMFLLMFIFGVLGHYLFGLDGNDTTKAEWGTLGNAMYTLWVYICCDNWSAYQDDLNNAGFGTGSQAFSAAFIWMGNFIVQNLFVGVICQNIDDANEADREYKTKMKEATRLAKREIFLQKQRKDLNQLVSQKSDQMDFKQLLQELAGRLRHEDLLPMSYLMCDPVWLETYVTTLNYHENTLYRIQQAQFDLAYTLAELAEKRRRKP